MTSPKPAASSISTARSSSAWQPDLRRATTSRDAPIDPPPRLFVGAVENAAAPPLEYRAERAAKKIEAGARFLQLQICYHPERLEAFVMRSTGDAGLPGRAPARPSCS